MSFHADVESEVVTMQHVFVEEEQMFDFIRHYRARKKKMLLVFSRNKRT